MTRGKSLNTLSRVAKQHAAGSEAVQHLLDLLIRAHIQVDALRQCDRFASFQFFDNATPFSKLRLFCLKLLEVRKARRVNQLQTIKVASQPRLFRGGSEKQQATTAGRQVANKVTQRRRVVANAGDVVRLVNDHHVPVKRHNMVLQGDIRFEE